MINFTVPNDVGYKKKIIINYSTCVKMKRNKSGFKEVYNNSCFNKLII